MQRAARSLLYFSFLGVLLAGSVVAVFEVALPLSKTGILEVYFSGLPSIVTMEWVSESYSLDSSLFSVSDLEIVSLNITIGSVWVHRSGSSNESGWAEVSSTPTRLDLMKSTNVSMLIAVGSVSEQNITAVRLFVPEATAATQDSTGTVELKPVVVSSGKLEVPLSSARVKGQLTTSLVLDRPHIVIQGNGVVRLTPVLHLARAEAPH